MFDMDVFTQVFAKVRGQPLTTDVSNRLQSMDGLRGKGGRGITDVQTGTYFPAYLFKKPYRVLVVCPFYSGNEVSNFVDWDLEAGDCPAFPVEWDATIKWAEKCFGKGGGVEYRLDGCEVPLEKILEFQGVVWCVS